MDHVITIKDVLFIGAILAACGGVVAIFGWALSLFASGLDH